MRSKMSNSQTPRLRYILRNTRERLSCPGALEQCHVVVLINNLDAYDIQELCTLVDTVTRVPASRRPSKEQFLLLLLLATIRETQKSRSKDESAESKFGILDTVREIRRGFRLQRYCDRLAEFELLTIPSETKSNGYCKQLEYLFTNSIVTSGWSFRSMSQSDVIEQMEIAIPSIESLEGIRQSLYYIWELRWLSNSYSEDALSYAEGLCAHALPLYDQQNSVQMETERAFFQWFTHFLLNIERWSWCYDASYWDRICQLCSKVKDQLRANGAIDNQFDFFIAGPDSAYEATNDDTVVE